MILLHRLRSIVQWMFRRTRAEQQLDDELRTFIELSAEDRIRAGVPPAEALRLARIELGGVEQVKERVRTYRHGAWLDEAGRDLRYAFRMVRKNPGFAGIVVLTLALGIGANTAIFSLIDALMLRWLPVRNPRELVQIVEPKPGGCGNESYSYAFVGAVAGHREIFSGLAGFSPYSFNVLVGDSVRRVPGALVTGEFYDTLGLAPGSPYRHPDRDAAHPGLRLLVGRHLPPVLQQLQEGVLGDLLRDVVVAQDQRDRAVDAREGGAEHPLVVGSVRASHRQLPQAGDGLSICPHPETDTTAAPG